MPSRAPDSALRGRVRLGPGWEICWLTQQIDAVAAGDGWLAPREREVQASLKFVRRREDWRLGRWTAKRILIERLGQAWEPSRLSILAAADGAPEAFLDGRPLAVSLSISHRDGWGLVAVGPPEVALGCDIENIEPRSAAFVSDYFTVHEQALVARAPVDERDLLTTLIWSAKESALKALREGLRLDTRSVEVQFEKMGRCEGWRALEVAFAKRRLMGRGRSLGKRVTTLAAGGVDSLDASRRIAS